MDAQQARNFLYGVKDLECLESMPELIEGIKEAADLLIAQQEQLAILQEIAREVARDDDITVYGASTDQTCVFCFGEEDYSDENIYKHETSCIVTKARALLEQKG